MVDARGSGPREKNLMQVQVLSSTPIVIRRIIMKILIICSKSFYDKIAVINEAKAKLRKNMLGVNISKIKNAIPQTASNCHKTIINSY